MGTVLRVREVLDQLAARFGAERAIVDPDELTAWECDGYTIDKGRPVAVVLPESTEEVRWIVEFLDGHDVPFVARGAGTCLSGGPTPLRPAVVIETARMKRILHVDPDGLFAVVEPGVVNAKLSEAVAHHGLHYAPDPSSQTVCTIGGNIAENSGGPHCFKYGMTTDHVLGLTVVLPSGAIARLGSAAGPRGPHELDLTGLFTGSEGTFGIATEITVRLSPNAERTHTLLASFRTMRAACGTVSAIVAAGILPAALEILDQATIRAVEASVFRAGYPQDAAAVLLVELDGAISAVEADAARVREFMTAEGALRIEEATDATERLRLWRGRKGAFGAMGRLNTDLYVLDGVVPRSRLVETLERVTEIGQRHGVTLTNVFHAGDGNLHPNISFDGRDAEERSRVLAAGHEILELCIRMGGSITGEHGVGSEKLDHVALMFDANDLEVMERVRTAFDPKRLSNPGKAIPERSACAEISRWPKIAERILREELT
ncbi:MAG: FAD-binding protein [Planctomycetes bacterium]|nr:FAD-binding protein [Planctomycetota bacterium]